MTARRKKVLRAADLFCGAGGFTTGAVASGRVQVVLAINHWRTAIYTMRELSVVDIGFRMLEPAELAAAQGFPHGYYLHGTKADQVRQVGNAVCPPIAEALCRTLAEAA